MYRTKLNRFWTTFVRLPFDLIVTSLSAWTEDPRTKRIFRTPNLGGKLALDAPAQFDLVLHMAAFVDDDGNSYRYWRTAFDGQVLAKGASGSRDEIEEPDWGKVFAKIRTQKGE